MKAQVGTGSPKPLPPGTWFPEEQLQTPREAPWTLLEATLPLLPLHPLHPWAA